ncbi:MAG: restriction endonuclease subunit S [Oscillospiraceae bacterium]
MSEWLKTSLIDIVELIGGGTPKTSKAEYWGGNINWLSVKDFNNETDMSIPQKNYYRRRA